MKQINPKLMLLVIFICSVLCTHCTKDDSNRDPLVTDLFSIQIEESSESAVKARIIPQDPKQDYFFTIVSKSDFMERWNGEVSKYLPDYIESQRKMHHCTLEEAITMIKHSGESVADSSSLFPSIMYVVMVAGVDNSGNLTTQPVIKEFTTTSLPKINCNLTVTLPYIGISRANVDIRPSDLGAYYMFGVVDAATFPSEPDKRHEFAQMYADKLIKEAATKYKLSYQDAVHCVRTCEHELRQYSPGSFSPESKYVAFAMCVDPSGYVRSDVATQPFTTKVPNVSGNILDIKLDITQIGVTFDVKTSNSSPYYLDIVLTSSIDGLTDDQLIRKYIISGAGSSAVNGNRSFKEWKDFLIPGTEFTLLIFGCDEWATTPLKRVNFKTNSGNDPALCSFKFNYKITELEIIYDVEPSDNSVFYYVNIMSTSDYPGDEQIKDETTEDVQRLLLDNPNIPAHYVIKNRYDRGKIVDRMFFNNFKKESATIYAVAIDHVTWKAVSVVSKESFYVD